MAETICPCDFSAIPLLVHAALWHVVSVRRNLRRAAQILEHVLGFRRSRAFTQEVIRDAQGAYGYITFHTVDRDGENESPGRVPGLREYRGRFLSGQLQNIVRVNEDRTDRVRYGLASFRWFHTPSFLFGDSDEESDASKADVGLGK